MKVKKLAATSQSGSANERTRQVATADQVKDRGQCLRKTDAEERIEKKILVRRKFETDIVYIVFVRKFYELGPVVVKL